MRSDSGKILPVILIIFAVLIVVGTVGAIFVVDYLQGREYNKEDERIPFGVFIGIDEVDDTTIEKLKGYATVVIEPDAFTKTRITELKEAGTVVYAYINIGSADKTADYYEQYKELALGEYEGWPDEVWINVSDLSWQEYQIARISEITSKGVNGFFVDNCDVYYYVTNGAGVGKADSGEIRQALLTMIQEMKKRYKTVIVNGADTFVSYCIRNNTDVTELMDGVCQESVYTAVNAETGEFEPAVGYTYYEAYLAKCKAANLAVYLIEYTDDETMIEKIKTFCETNEYKYYITDSLELD